MKNFKTYLDAVVNESNGPQEGHYFDLVLNEELAIQTDIVAIEENRLFIGLDQEAFHLLEAAGLMELADDPGYQGSTGTALGGKPATTAAAAAKPAPSGANNPQAGAKPVQSGAGLRQAQAAASAAGSPAPTPVGTKVYPASDAMTLKMAQQTSGRAGTSTAPKTPAPKRTGGGAPGNPQQAAVDAANAVQKGQMDKLAGNTPASAPDIEGMKQGIAAGSPAAQAAQSAPAPQANALGVMPQANIPGSPTATAEPAATAPQANPFGIMPQANVPGSPTAGQPAAAQTSTSKTPGLDSATTPQGQAVGGETVPTRGGPAVTGGFGQETNVSTRSADEIAADNKAGYGRYQPQATKSYSSVGDFAKAVGNKLGIGNKPAATPATTSGATTSAVPEPNIQTKPLDQAQNAPSTMAEDAEFARMLDLAGVRRG